MKSLIKQYTTYRLIKSEDLNHHGTLFAGRGAEWFVESGFVAASHLLPPQNLICVRIHELNFQQPVRLGEGVCFNSRIVYAGKSSLIAYISVKKNKCDDIIVDGFATFVHVDANTNSMPHGIELEPDNEEDIALMGKAIKMKSRE